MSSNYLGNLSTVTPDQVKKANTTNTNYLADKEQSPLRSERELRVPALALSCTAAVPTTEPYRRQRGAHYGAQPPEIWRCRRSIHSYPSLVKTTDKEQSGQGDASFRNFLSVSWQALHLTKGGSADAARRHNHASMCPFPPSTWHAEANQKAATSDGTVAKQQGNCRHSSHPSHSVLSPQVDRRPNLSRKVSPPFCRVPGLRTVPAPEAGHR